MNIVDAFSVGIAPQHVPALIAAGLLPVLVMVVRRLRPHAPAPPFAAATVPAGRAGPALATVRRWAAWLLGTAAVVHLALPLGHYDGPVLTIAFLADGAGGRRCSAWCS